jgi:enamine deaminase RidA (YjgF/YER057c/UK114 family)
MQNPFDISYFQSANPDLKTAIHDLLKNIPAKEKCLSLVFFGNTDIKNYSADCEELIQVVLEHFPTLPLITFIPQPLCSPLTFGLEVTQYKSDTEFEFKQLRDTRYVVFNSEWGKTILIESTKADSLLLDYTTQCNSVFEKISSVFNHENVGIQHIIRQWNYVGDITEFENGNQHYQLFNNARSEFYNNVNFENGYPAATGISMSLKSIFVSVLAIVPTTETIIAAIDNSLQIPAYKYSETVLVEGKTNHLKTTPKFERGKFITNGKSRIFYVSGTAAIRAEQSTNPNDAALQTRQTVENINFLISNENIQRYTIEKNVYLSLNSIRVYVKRCEDYVLIKAEVEKAWPNVTVIYLLAEVCRTELLVEIEGIAS